MITRSKTMGDLNKLCDGIQTARSQPKSFCSDKILRRELANPISSSISAQDKTVISGYEQIDRQARPALSPAQSVRTDLRKQEEEELIRLQKENQLKLKEVQIKLEQIKIERALSVREGSECSVRVRGNEGVRTPPDESTHQVGISANVTTHPMEDLAKAIRDLTLRTTPPRVINDVTFTGKPGDWMMFKTSFTETSQQFRYTKKQDVLRLRSLLKGEALEAVSSLLISCGDPEEIMEVLERRFASPEVIVAEQVNCIKSLPRLNNMFSKDLSVFASKIHNALSTLRILNRGEYIQSPELFNSILSKLTPLMRSQFVNYAAEMETGEPSCLLLSRFLNREADRHMKYGGIAQLTAATGSFSPAVRSNQHRVLISAVEPKKRNCSYCSNDHDIQKCPKFMSLIVDARWQWACTNYICFKCLRYKHSTKDCKAKSCGVNGCRGLHHRLLHKSRPQVPAVTMNVAAGLSNEQSQLLVTESLQRNASVPVSTQSITSVRPPNNIPHQPVVEEPPERTAARNEVTHAAQGALQRRTFLKILPVTVFGPKGTADIFALLDEGSTTSLLDNQLAEKIGLNGPIDPLTINVIGGVSLQEVPSKTVSFYIKGQHINEKFKVHGVRTIPELLLTGQSIDKAVIDNCTHLVDIKDFLTLNSGRPTLLLGQDQWHLIVSLELRRGSPSQPVASRTALGWVAHGACYSICEPINFCSFVSTKSCHCDVELERLIKEQYALDSIGVTKKEFRSIDDERALRLLQETVRQCPDGHYEVGLLWRNDSPNLPNSYPMALSRLHSVEKKMDADVEYAARYTAQIDDMLAKGYAVRCDDSTTLSDSGRRWYLPHFGVINSNKPNKLRIVHDAAAKVAGMSLNTALLIGPDLIQPLLGILLRFREGKYAFQGDIREMFMQCRIRSEDREAQRFLWRGNRRHGRPDQYEMVSMIFGAACSPTSAIYIKNLNAQVHIKEYPEAAAAIIQNHYLDDAIVSIDNLEMAQKLATDITLIHQFCGYEMRGWTSNDSQVLLMVAEDRRKDLPVNLSPNDSTQRTLGLLWDPIRDVFKFDVNLRRVSDKVINGQRIPTKREILSVLMSIFDPLGLLGPLVIRGRVIFQDVWRSSIDWDQQLREPEYSKWLTWFEHVKSLSDFYINRWYQEKLDVVERQLHVFTDAGESSYGAAGYLRLLYENGHIQVVLIASKARVSPLKATSVPRLELQAALLGSKLANYIVLELSKKPDSVVFWCDSSTVLAWLSCKDHRRFKQFVAQRVANILDLTRVEQWRWLPSAFNVADLLTRVTPNNVLGSDGVWFKGAQFLYKSPDEWPKSYNSQNHSGAVEELVVATVENVLYCTPVVPDPERFSNWSRYLRATAYVYKWCRRFTLRKHSLADTYCESLIKPLTAEDLNYAEKIIWQATQQKFYSKEIILLKNSRPLPRASSIFKLNPTLDVDGMLRLGGRIDNVDNVNINKRPTILPGQARTVQLLIKFYHERYAHANTNTVLNSLRQVYWITKLRATLRSVVRRCQGCRRYKSKAVIPPEGALPIERLDHHRRPFTHVGLDYFGPLVVTIGRRTEKRWVALFTCMVVRAIHLELVWSLSADSAIMALQRFIARRGCPSTIFSDNATCFRGASAELIRESQTMDEAVRSFAAGQRISWKFLPAAAPSMAGVYERLVQNVKKVLELILKERKPKALSPLHFLLIQPSPAIKYGETEEHDFVRRKEWRKAQRLADSFWARWVKEYLPTLQVPHYRGQASSPAVGDIVLVADPSLPRNTWPLGKIEALYPGGDGITRVVDVRTAGGTF